jgi:glycerol-3-phosphate dehydrogenase (NAD(P)+)
VSAARAVLEVAGKAGVEMPIAEQVALVLHQGRPMRDAVRALMSRELRAES